MKFRRYIAILAGLIAVQPAFSCAFDDNLAAFLKKDLDAKSGGQTVGLQETLDGRDLSMQFAYVETEGTPNTADTTIQLPRRYFAEMFGWMDVFALCSAGECPDVKPYVDAYPTHELTDRVPTWINIVGDNAEICARRQDPAYGQYLGEFLQAGMVFLQLRELGKAAIVPQADRGMDEMDLAKADAFAVHGIATLFPEKPEWLSFAAVAVLPRLHGKYLPEDSTALYCRLSHLMGVGSAAVFIEPQDCSAYDASYQTGLAQSAMIVGPDTKLAVTP